MKNLIILLVLLIFVPLLTKAKPINELTAKNVGKNFYLSLFPQKNKPLNLTLIFKQPYINNNSNKSQQYLFYVFNINSTGFVIVAGDDNVIPILGYSKTSTYNLNSLPPNFTKWIETYKREIRDVIINKTLAPRFIQKQWMDLKEGHIKYINENKGSVNPLLQTQWNQSPYYNAQCPGGSVTGCVATAMAQVMKYWSYPSTGTGFHSYNHSTYGTLSANFGSTTYQWSSMPNNVNSPNNAVATLMYQVGVSVNMNYSPQSSGAYVISAASPITNCAEYALKTYFRYKSTLHGELRSNYSDAQWLSLLKTELNANRPIIYAGFGSGGGHCFVADGYDNNNYIHFNWGWGGSFNGYFYINALNPNGVGTGGGTGGYNSGHQAIFGVEPPNNSVNYNLTLYDNLNLSSSNIYYGQAFSVNTNVLNNGNNTFSGDYAIAIFDNQYYFIGFVDSLIGYTLSSGYVYSNNLMFSTNGLFSMLPGTYYLALFYKPTGSNWYIVSSTSSHTNLAQITVTNSNNIALNSNIIYTPSSLSQGSPISVNFNIVNNGNNTFVGKYGVGIYKFDGTLAQTIGLYNEINGLPSGYTYNSPYITLTNSSINVTPGTYLLAVQHNPNNSGWQLTGSTSSYQNPIKIIISAPTIQPDVYEPNNSLSQAYDLSHSFTNNTLTLNTNGSNCHINSDNDYYKIVLPSGYNYSITPRLHDSNNSGNGKTYSLDALFSYSKDGTNWSNTYDDIFSGNIIINNGGIVYFHVAPFFVGNTGTYLFEVSISRSSINNVNQLTKKELFKLYPNPANDEFIIYYKNNKTKINRIEIINSEGKIVKTYLNIKTNNQFTIKTKDLPPGVYITVIYSNDNIIRKKVTIQR